MNSRWIKALTIVLVVWGIMLTGKALMLNVGLGILPHLINIDLDGMGAQASRDESNSFPAAGLNSVWIDTSNGSITVVGSDAEEITVSANYRARSSSQQDAERKLEDMGTTISVTNDRLEIQAAYGPGSRNGKQISYEISVPRQLLVRADTANGAITAIDLQGRLELTTQNGAIDVTSDQGPSDIQARTSNGAIHVVAAPANGSYTLQTSNGKVEVYLPAGLGIELDGSVGNGSIDIGDGEWSILGGKLSNRQIKATRGDGSLQLTVSTSNGQIVVGTRE